MITSIVAQILCFKEEQRTVVFTSLEGTESDAVQGTIFNAVHTDSEQSGGALKVVKTGGENRKYIVQ